MPVKLEDITFAVYVDWDADGNFNTLPVAPKRVADDITRYVKKVEIKAGLPDELELMADVGSCTITLNNADLTFSDANTRGDLYGKLENRKQVKVYAVNTVTGKTYQRFFGYINDIKPTGGLKTERECTLECVDLLGILQGHTLALPLLTGMRGDQMVTHIVNESFGAPYASGRFDFTANPVNNDTATVNGTVYTYKTTPSTPANEVILGTSYYARYESIRVLKAAINGDSTSGTNIYSVATSRPSYCKASLSPSFYQAIIDLNPVWYLRCDETSGTVINNYGQNGIGGNGTITGGYTLASTALVSGDATKGVSLNGTTGTIPLPTLDINYKNLTVSAWFNTTALPAAHEHIFNVYTSYAANQMFWIEITSTGAIAADFYGSGAYSAGGLISAGTTYHVVATYDYTTTTLYVYLNGVLVASNTGCAGYSGAINPIIYIGSERGLFQWFSGKIQDVTLDFKAWTPAQISAVYAARTISPGLTITSTLPGTVGNAFTLADTSAGITVSGATLSGGSDLPSGAVFETGLQTFDYGGQEWGAGDSNALSAIKQITESERGLFYQSLDGVLYWRNRNYIFTSINNTPTATLANDVMPEFSKAVDKIYNIVIVNYTPRGTATSGAIAKATSNLEVPGLSSAVYEFPYSDTVSALPVVATALTLPLVPNTDFTAGEVTSNDIGGYYTSFLFLKFEIENLNSKARVTITNTATGKLTIFGFQIRGSGLIAYNATNIKKTDATSKTKYQDRTLTIDLPLTTSSSFADAVATYYLNRYKNPFLRVESMDFGNRIKSDGVDIYSLAIGDIIPLTNVQTGFTNVKHQVINIENTLGQRGGNALKIFVRRVDDSQYGVWDSSTLGLFGSAIWAI